MKRLFTHVFTFLLLTAMVLTFAACSNDTTAADGSGDGKKETLADDIADYTVIFWGMAGSNDYSASLDFAKLTYLYQQGKIGKNVQIAGLMKTSLSKASLEGAIDSSYDKTMYFDSENIGTDYVKEEEFQNVETVADIQKLYKKAFDNMGGKVYGDTLYPLYNVDSLANFIKNTAQKFPARHYVLMLFGHGSGFSPEDDTPMSRACVYDSEFNQWRSLSADAVVNAVEKSGVKMQSLFTQCCLMATLENIAAYSQAFDYGILSAEPTTGFYFPQYLANLSTAGDDETAMQQESRKLVDYYADVAAGQFTDLYSSHGFYDLKKAGALLSATKEAADWFISNYAIDSQQDAIKTALSNSIVSIELEDYMSIPEETKRLRQARQKIQDVMSGKTSISNWDENEFMDYIQDAYTLIYNFSGSTGFCMADVMRNTIYADLPQEKTNELKVIYEKYMAALKDMAYIRTTNKPANANADYEYVYASPTVNVFSMHPDYFIPMPSGDRLNALFTQIYQALIEEDGLAFFSYIAQLLNGTKHANNCDLNTVKTNYSSSVFNKQVGWSKFLEQLQCNPSLASCPDRWQVNQGME